MTQELCRFYGSEKGSGCRYGDNCRYSHVNSTTICKFNLNNSCIYGNECKDKHNTYNVKSTINDIANDENTSIYDSTKIMSTNDVGEIKFKRVFYIETVEECIVGILVMIFSTIKIYKLNLIILLIIINN
eukprot:802090_1